MFAIHKVSILIKYYGKEAMRMLPKISKPATRALNQIGITTIEQVASRSEEELLSLHGVGPKAIKTLQVALNEKGLKFKQDEK